MISVRPARESDGHELARIDLATWTDSVSPAPPPAAPSGYDFFGDRIGPGDVLVAEMDGVMAGWVKVRCPTALPSHVHVLEIGGLAVDPSLQGAGVGQRLVEAAVGESVRRGARKLTLRVLAPNMGARRLYERCGFVVEGVLREEFLLGGQYVDDVLMAHYLATVSPPCG